MAELHYWSAIISKLKSMQQIDVSISFKAFNWYTPRHAVKYTIAICI